MDSVEAYLADITAAIRPLPTRELPVAEALGAVLTDDVTALHPLPSFDNSAMDGYAVRSADVTTASPEHPVVLAVTGEVAAGDTRRHDLVAGTALKIMTGAALPAGADAVVPVEQTDGGTERVAISQAAATRSRVTSC
jgi:molybdopterin molybdotransferase